GTAAQSDPSSGYHNNQALTQALRQLAQQNPQITKLISIGKTLKGRDIWLLQVSGNKGLEPETKQALLICGNLEGDHLIGSEVALGIAGRLINGYGKDDNITATMDKRTFYIVPRLNPDGAELFFNQVRYEYSGNLRSRDEDYDWVADEDGPEDLNGDGMITMMRVKDKEGDWYIDKKDPRLMKKKQADTPLDQLYSLYPEGIDNDGDELYNEDGPGGFNINRNFPHNFGYKTKGVGVYPASETETRALIDFMTKYIPEVKSQPHRNVCGVLVFSKCDNLAAGTGIEGGTPTFPQPAQAATAAGRPTRMMFMFGRRGQQEAPRPRPTDPQPKKTNAQDEPLFKSVSTKYKELTKIKSAQSGKPVGSLMEWAYFQFGVPAFSANLWSLRQDAPSRPQGKMPTKKPAEAGQTATPDRAAMMRQMMAGGGAGGGRSAASASSSNDDKWLKWIDDKNEGKGFVAWTKYNHKQLGEVEIGGFVPYLRVNPPAEQIKELSRSHTDFALYLASQFAEITLEGLKVKKLSSGLFELKLTLHNQGQFPYATAMGQRARSINPIVLQLKFENDDDMQLFGGSKRIDVRSLKMDEEKEYKWIIISPPGKQVDISLYARNGGGKMLKQIVLK
ncbi:MAG: hypothetical protein GQ544_07940, partial [Candidatus Aminicenantes bacterium]|nr:hypothetical protein [Candidatus Aminicenantes bacterium]